MGRVQVHEQQAPRAMIRLLAFAAIVNPGLDGFAIRTTTLGC
jgi:hypothetical protein